MSILRGLSNCLKRFVQPTATSRYCSTNAANTESEPEEMSNTQNRNRIVWIDMEMTGLDVETDRILEVACIITDENLHIVSEKFQAVVHQPESRLTKMNEWCIRQHNESGLTEASRRSQEDERTVDANLLYFMMKYVPKGKCPMAGNSVYMDRLFLRKYMPISNDYMHYRIIDVSSIKEVVKRWRPEIYSSAPEKLLNHRALGDIEESIMELDFYRKHIFNSNFQI